MTDSKQERAEPETLGAETRGNPLIKEHWMGLALRFSHLGVERFKLLPKQETKSHFTIVLFGAWLPESSSRIG